MPTNSRDEYARTIRAGAAGLGTQLAMASLVSKVPILANPFLYKIAEYFVQDLVEGLVLKTEFGIFFQFIDLRSNKQGTAFFNAVKARQGLPKDATPAQKEKAEREQIKAFADLVSWTT